MPPTKQLPRITSTFRCSCLAGTSALSFRIHCRIFALYVPFSFFCKPISLFIYTIKELCFNKYKKLLSLTFILNKNKFIDKITHFLQIQMHKTRLLKEPYRQGCPAPLTGIHTIQLILNNHVDIYYNAKQWEHFKIFLVNHVQYLKDSFC